MLLLTWDHPLDIQARSARLIRGSVVVTEDITWGVAVDPENSDLTAQYQVEYIGLDGTAVLQIQPQYIRKFPRPDSVSEIAFLLFRSDGTPDSNRLIEVSDLHEPGEPESTRTFATNYNGKASIFLRRGARQYIHLENTRLGLDVIVPDSALVTYDDLLTQGSRIIHERRGWF